jgi:hypothetical protein
MVIMNPFVLLHIFSNADWTKKYAAMTGSTKAYMKAEVDERLRKDFSESETCESDPKLLVLHTAFLLAKVVHLVLKRTLTWEDKLSFNSDILNVRSSLFKVPHQFLVWSVEM